MPGIRTFRDLVVWQLAMELVGACYAATKRFPGDERFGLVSQIRRASVSVAANIAEGHGRASRGEYRHFLGVARGSLRELETLILVAGRLDYLSTSTHAELLRQIDDVARLLHGLATRLVLPKSPAPRPQPPDPSRIG